MTDPGIDQGKRTPARIITDERTRAYIYRIALALLVLAVALRLLPLGISDEVLEVIRATLGITSAGLAAANTSTRS